MSRDDAALRDMLASVSEDGESSVQEELLVETRKKSDHERVARDIERLKASEQLNSAAILERGQRSEGNAESGRVWLRRAATASRNHCALDTGMRGQCPRARCC